MCLGAPAPCRIVFVRFVYFFHRHSNDLKQPVWIIVSVESLLSGLQRWLCSLDRSIDRTGGALDTSWVPNLRFALSVTILANTAQLPTIETDEYWRSLQFNDRHHNNYDWSCELIGHSLTLQPVLHATRCPVYSADSCYYSIASIRTLSVSQSLSLSPSLAQLPLICNARIISCLSQSQHTWMKMCPHLFQLIPKFSSSYY